MVCLLMVAVGGCSMSLSMQSTRGLNPRPRVDNPTGSKEPALLEYLVLQLSKVETEQRRTLINQTHDSWSRFADEWRDFRSKGSFPEFLKPYLAYPATLPESERPKEHFILQPNQLLIEDLPRRLTTAHLLVIALGAERLPSSVRLINVGLTDNTISLCFHEYEAFTSDSGPWPCPPL